MDWRDRWRSTWRRLSEGRRRIWRGHRRLWIEVRPVLAHEQPGFADDVARRIGGLPGVAWARYNAPLNRVVVHGIAHLPDEEAVLETLRALETERGQGRRPFDVEPPEHPGDQEAVTRMLVEAGIDGLALLAGMGRRLAGWKTPPADIDLQAVLRVLEGIPRARQVLDERLGAASADLALSLSNAVTGAFGAGPTGPLLDAAYRATRVSDLWRMQALWALREEELAADPDDHPDVSVGADARPGQLPDGPIETYTAEAVVAALGGFGAGVATTRSFEKAAAMLFTGLPRPARFGRNGWASAFARRLAEAGVVVRRPRSLRRLDRIDVLVVDGRLLDPVGGEIVEVHALNGRRRSDVRRRCLAMFDVKAPFSVVEGRRWTLGPLSQLKPGDRPEVEALRARAAPGGRVLALVHDGELAGLVAVRPEVDPEAEALVVAAEQARLRLVVATEAPARLSWLGPEHLVGTGDAARVAVRDLQARDHGVLVVWRGPDGPYEAADVSLGLREVGRPPAWTADLIGGEGLSQVRLLLSGIPAARRTAQQSVQLASVEAVAGLALALQKTGTSTTRRILAVSNLASGLALANGRRIAAGVAPPVVLGRRDHTPWWALDGPTVLARLDTRAEGLTTDEAAARRPIVVGEAPDPPGVVRALIEEVSTPIAPVLATGAALSALMGSVVDGLLVAGILGLNGVVGAAQRLEAERALAALERRERLPATVRRNGEEVQLPADELVVGDIITLRAGDLVPADCRILEAVGVEADESALTGESVPVHKTPSPSFSPALADRTSMLWQGTTLAAGDAVAVVIAVGEQTEGGRALGKAVREEVVSGGVEARLEALTNLTVPAAAFGGLAVLVSGLARNRPPDELVGAAVALAVAAVPEGLPVVTMLAQLAAARRLAGHGALVRNPRAVEALGRVDMVCADKTGTLTEGRLRLRLVAAVDEEAPIASLGPASSEVLRIALRASPRPDARGRVAHPTDQALLDGASEAGVALGAWTLIDELPFDPERSYAASLGAVEDGLVVAVKGSPEAVLSRCNRVREGEGTASLSASRKRALLETARGLASRGLRVLAVAERGARERKPLDDRRVRSLVFRGFLGIADPPRPSAAASVADLRKAGVDVAMITGDHPATAAAIARELGIADDPVVLTGAELEALDDAALADAMRTARVFARVTPHQKVRIVQGMRRLGHVVAMTGDGANDAPAIRLADVGIALGTRATAAARHAADLVVVDDRIETIVRALLEGRALWTSVRGAVALLLGGNLGEVGFTVLGGLADGRSPLNTRQLLLVNLLTDALPVMAMALRPPSDLAPGALAAAGPERSLGTSLEREIVWRAAVTGTAAGAAWWTARVMGGRKKADTVGLLALVGAQLGQTMVLGYRSPAVLASGAGSLAALLALVQFPATSRFFGSRPLGPLGLAQAATAAGLATAAATVGPPVFSWIADAVREHAGDDEDVEAVRQWLLESRVFRRLTGREGDPDGMR